MTDTSGITGSGGKQYLRKVSLLVQLGNDQLDLSNMKFTFSTRQSDVQTPNSCYIRIYNLSDQTVAKIVGPTGNSAQNQGQVTAVFGQGFAGNTSAGPEFKAVTLSAGYQNAQFGLVFQGTLKQTRRGRENAVDTYLDLLVADSDLAYNYAVVNQTLAAGSSSQDVFDVLVKANQEAQPGASAGISSGLSSNGLLGGVLPRGKVLFGMARDTARDLAKTTQSFWSIQNGKLQFTKRTSYKPGTSVVLNANTGLVGQPEQTEEGIRITCLLNPSIVIGSVVNINNKDINATTNQPGNITAYDNPLGGPQLLASVAADGNYRAFVVEHHGDTRGNDWHTSITGLSIDISAPAATAVPAGVP